MSPYEDIARLYSYISGLASMIQGVALAVIIHVLWRHWDK